MQGKQLNIAMESAVSSTDWTTVSATGTKYSKWHDVSLYDELGITQTAVYANQDGATLDTSIQMYNNGLATQFDHGTTFTQIANDATERKTFSAFENKIRLKLVFGGTFRASPKETITVTAGIVGKG